MPVLGPCLQPGAVQQMARDQALRHLQQQRDQFRLRGRQQAQRDRLPRW